MTADRDKARDEAQRIMIGSVGYGHANSSVAEDRITEAILAARAEERGRCAKVAEAIVANNGVDYEESDGAFLAASYIAAAIRSR